jgi:hypothetical protein
MNKKWVAALLSMMMLLLVGVTGAFASGPKEFQAEITLDGEKVALDKSVYIANGRTLLPYRALAEMIGAIVNYDAASKVVTVQKDSNVYVLSLGSKVAMINGTAVELDVPAQLIGDSTYVPIRFLSENLGAFVQYDGAAKKISLTTKNDPSFKVFGVNSGDILYTNEVKVSVAAFNHALMDFRTNMEPKEGQGHVHLWLDTEAADPKAAYKLISGDPVTFKDVAPGDHTLTILLVGNNHKPLATDGKQVITFKTAPTPTVKVTGPKEGEVIVGNKVTVTTEVMDFILSDFRTNTAVASGEGHLHIWLDSDVTNPKIAYKQINGEPVTFDNVQPGDHTLTVQLVGANHKPIQPVVKHVVHFKTK